VGLGLEAARHCVRLGAAKVVLGCRSTEKGEAAKADIEASTRCAPGVVEMWHVDLSSFESVKAFCRRAADTLPRIDVLLANAGLAIGEYVENDGHESSVAVNVISPFLMALMLLPALRRTAVRYNDTTHVVVVSSDAHVFVSYVPFSIGLPFPLS